MSCGVSFMKFTLVFFNSIFLLIGIAGTGVGIWIAVDHQSLFELIDYTTTDSTSLIQTGAYIFIAGSVFVVLIAILGIIGACTQNKCMLGFYAFFVILIFALELAALITVIVYDTQFQSELQGELLTQLRKRYNSNATNNAFVKSVDTLQGEFKCCGITNATDYDSLNLTPSKYPKSCYPDAKIVPANRFTEGCYTVFRGLIKKYIGAIIGIVVAVLVFELILFVFAICLTRHDDFGNKMV